jgi:aldehyde:ferredoxin oxidoreductase
MLLTFNNTVSLEERKLSQGGYMDKILRVDLSKMELKEEGFPEDWKKKYLGGSGVAARIIYDEVPPEIDAFDPRNVLCIFAGPYTGTFAPCSGRYGAAAKSPLTGGWGEANSAGFWGAELKFAGFDGIIVKGKSQKPLYLWVNDGKAELKSAEDLWGKTTVETKRILEERHGNKTKVLSIGPAGEKLVRFACLINDNGRAAGRCGLGAVMGSKKLKAIAVQGTKTVPIADQKTFADLVKEYTETITNHLATVVLGMGTAGGVKMAEELGDFPVKNWRLGSFPEAADLDFSGDPYQKIFIRKDSCYRCPIGCGRWIKVDKEIAGVKPFEGHGPEYETIGVFGGALQNSDIETIAAANYLCDSYGLDTISTGAMIAFAYEAYEKGIITKKDVGFELKWGDGEAAVKMTRMIAEREGIGDLLAEGPITAAQKLGKGAHQFALHVKGQPTPAHDPRVYAGVAVEYATSNRGACHLQGQAELWQSEESFYSVQFQIDPAPFRFFGVDFDGLHTNEGKGKAIAITMSGFNTLDALVFCAFTGVCLPSGEEITKLTNAIAGWNLKPQDLLTIGERLVALKRAFNIRCGFTREDDKLPERLLTPAPDVPEKHAAPNLEIQLREFYETMGWDWDTGKPTRERLSKLGLKDVADDLW